MVVATNAPLLPHQLKRIARRVPMGLARVGSYAGNGSGDIFIAFSTANPGAAMRVGEKQAEFLPNDSLSPLFLATVQATEEADRSMPWLRAMICAASTVIWFMASRMTACGP